MKEKLTQILGKEGLLLQEPLSLHTTFRIGGPAAYYAVPSNKDQLVEVISYCRETNTRYYLLGKGSNVLFADEGFDGVVIEFGNKISEVIWLDDKTVCAAAGISLTKLAMLIAGKGLTGFEFASGIPGTLGGGVTMNAGAYGGEIKDCICEAVVLDENGKEKILSKDELMLGYRSSVIQTKGYIVLSATFSFQPGDSTVIQETMRELNARRKEKQPLEYPSAGSTFKRPEGYFAGKLIQDAGLKGYRVGGAMVSEKHSGFVINVSDATAADVMQLIEDVKNRVKEQFQVELEPEVRLIK